LGSVKARYYFDDEFDHEIDAVEVECKADKTYETPASSVSLLQRESASSVATSAPCSLTSSPEPKERDIPRANAIVMESRDFAAACSPRQHQVIPAIAKTQIQAQSNLGSVKARPFFDDEFDHEIDAVEVERKADVTHETQEILIDRASNADNQSETTINMSSIDELHLEQAQITTNVKETLKSTRFGDVDALEDLWNTYRSTSPASSVSSLPCESASSVASSAQCSLASSPEPKERDIPRASAIVMESRDFATARSPRQHQVIPAIAKTQIQAQSNLVNARSNYDVTHETQEALIDRASYADNQSGTTINMFATDELHKIQAQFAADAEETLKSTGFGDADALEEMLSTYRSTSPASSVSSWSHESGSSFTSSAQCSSASSPEPEERDFPRASAIVMENRDIATACSPRRQKSIPTVANDQQQAQSSVSFINARFYCDDEVDFEVDDFEVEYQSTNVPMVELDNAPSDVEPDPAFSDDELDIESVNWVDDMLNDMFE
jgi:hypothetical protein